MFEIIVFASFILSLVAFAKARGIAEKLKFETESLRRDIEALKAGRPLAEPDTIASTATSAAALDPAAATQGGAESGEASPAGPWSDIARGDAIFGGAPSQAREQAPDAGEQERVEKASRGEPVDRAVAAAAVPAGKKSESLESRIGARWAVWVGGLALALGGIFMVKYSIESGLLSPMVRLWIAAGFGALLLLAGEIVRRRAVPALAAEFNNAMIPGILTAAGAVTLFGVVFAAHGIYGFIGPTPAFVLLAIVALTTVGLSLLHGQALAGLGLLASLATPALVSSDSPAPWPLFTFLTVAWLATLLAARIRRWNAVPSLANAGLGGWVMLYAAFSTDFETLPPVLALVVMIAGIGAVWPGGSATDSDDTPQPADGRPVPGRWERLLTPPFIAITLTGAIFSALPALLLISPALDPLGNPVAGFVAITAALGLLAVLRSYAVYPAIFAALIAVCGLVSITAGGTNALSLPLDPSAPVSDTTVTGTAMALSALFVALAALAMRLWLRPKSAYATLWSLIAAAVPFALIGISFLMTGTFVFDSIHGAAALALGAVLLLLAFYVTAQDVPPEDGDPPQGFFVAGSFAAFVLALHAMTDGLATTLLVAVLGFAYVLATRFVRWPVLPWVQVGAAIVVLGRIAWEPTIVGPLALSTTPVFNQLLAGYGVPAVLLVASAYLLRNWPGQQVRNLLQALASLFALLAVAILVRHAMNGGVLDSSVPTLGEQSIYTLLVIGASGILMTLNRRSPSPVFAYGSMVAGVVSMVSVLTTHLGGLNPYFTGEFLGSIPFLDLLLIGYLLPGLAYAGLAWYARGKRPPPYVTALAVCGAVLGFAWATLSVRRFWQGQSIADWKGFLEGETYTYSVVWLLLGVVLLALGSRFNAKSIRLASAVLVFVAVLKVFLVDMSNLEGFLRALSFIGLGAVLIGIGLFYQKILSSKAGTPPEPVETAEPGEGQEAASNA